MPPETSPTKTENTKHRETELLRISIAPASFLILKPAVSTVLIKFYYSKSKHKHTKLSSTAPPSSSPPSYFKDECSEFKPAALSSVITLFISRLAALVPEDLPLGWV